MDNEIQNELDRIDEDAARKQVNHLAGLYMKEFDLKNVDQNILTEILLDCIARMSMQYRNKYEH